MPCRAMTRRTCSDAIVMVEWTIKLGLPTARKHCRCWAHHRVPALLLQAAPPAQALFLFIPRLLRFHRR